MPDRPSFSFDYTLSVWFHDCHHSNWTAMLVAGIHLKTVSVCLGRCTIGMTMNLQTQAVRELDAEATDKLGTVFWRARKVSASRFQYKRRTPLPIVRPEGRSLPDQGWHARTDLNPDLVLFR